MERAAPIRSGAAASGRAPGRLPSPIGGAPAALGRIHAALGNQGAQRFLRAQLARAQITVSQPQDTHEVEAERVADEVMGMAAAPAPPTCDACAGEHARVDREEAGEEREEDETAERVVERTAGTALGAPGGGEDPPPGASGARALGLTAAGDPLPASERAFFEPRFGTDFGHVRIHAGESAERAARAIDARAFTSGSDIAFAAGEYAPGVAWGRRLLAHELTHVVQQTGGGAAGAVQRQPGHGGGAGAAPGAAPEQTIALSASMDGLRFMPHGFRFHAGPRPPQGIAIALRRLIGDQYGRGLENAATTALGLYGLGSVSGRAPVDEDAPDFLMFPAPALRLVRWLEREGYDVQLTPAQRDLLTLGVYATAAWADVHVLSAELGEGLPAWYPEAAFRSDLANHASLLREYVAAADAYHDDRSPENRAVALQALRNIVQALAPGAAVLEAVRSDRELTSHPVYSALWPDTATGPAARGAARVTRMARPNETPNPVIASEIMGFSYTQPEIVRQAMTTHEGRVELLDRFLRFVTRALTTSAETDQVLSDGPARANTPMIPSHLSSSPELEPPLFDASLETDHLFVMNMHYADVFEAFARYSYDWTYVRVPDQQIGAAVDPDTLPASRTSVGDVASLRLARAGRYADADIHRALDTIVGGLGPAGVGAVELAAANAILRYVGTGIRLGLELLTSMQSEKHLVFPSEGLYIVRCKGIPVVEGQDEVVRTPSVAYLPVFARSAVSMAETRVSADMAGRSAALARVAELQALLSQPVDRPDQDALERELEDLLGALGSAEDALENQIRRLQEAHDALPERAVQRRAIEHQLESLRLRLEVRQKRAREHTMAGAERLIAAFVSDEGQPVRLALEAVNETSEADRAGHRVSYWVSDITTANSGQARRTRATRAAAITAALQAILEDTGGYGRGHVSVEIDGTMHRIRIEASAGAMAMEALENISTAMSLAAVAAAPFTGGGSLVLLVPAGVLGAIPSAYRLITRAIDSTLRMDLQTAMDVVNIAGTLVGLGGELAGGLRMVRLGNAFMIAGIGLDGMNMLLMGAGVIQQIMEIQGLPPGERAARLSMIIGQAMLNVGIAVGGSLFHGRGAHEGGEHGAAPHEGPAPHEGGEPPGPRRADEPAAPRPAQEPGATPRPEEPAARPAEEGHGPTRPPEAPTTDPALANVESTRTVELGGESHHVRVVDEHGVLTVEVCSDCRMLRSQIDRVINDPAVQANPALRAALENLHQRAARLERELNRAATGRPAMEPEAARAECNAIAEAMAQLAGEHGSVLNPMVGIPRGFHDAPQLQRFGDLLGHHLEGLVSYFEAYVGGSSVTGENYHTGEPYGPHSDVDLAIVSPELLAAAAADGVDTHGGSRTDKNPLPTVLDPIRAELSALLGGRQVDIMVYGTRRAMEGRGDHIAVPRAGAGGPGPEGGAGPHGGPPPAPPGAAPPVGPTSHAPPAPEVAPVEPRAPAPGPEPPRPAEPTVHPPAAEVAAAEPAAIAHVVDEAMTATADIPNPGRRMLEVARRLSRAAGLSAQAKLQAILAFFRRIGFAISRDGIVERETHYVIYSEDNRYAFRFDKATGEITYGRFSTEALDYVWEPLR